MDSSAGEVALLQGQEIINNARTTAYLENGIGPKNLQISGNCNCSAAKVIALLDCPGVTEYTNPTADNAPWYDSAFPESGDFAGFYVTEFTGIESTYKREVFPVIQGGGILGRLRPEPRTLTWKGWLFGRSCCGAAYGLRWLTQQLAQTDCDDCSGEQLTFLVCCPDASCDSCAPVSSNVDPWRTAYNVGLVEGPLVTSERKGAGSCAAGCSNGQMIEIEFSMVAGNPRLYQDPIVVAECETFPEGQCPIWIKVPPGSCPVEPFCPEIVSCTFDPGCPPPTLPIITTDIDPCICDPLAPVQTCIEIPASTFGRNFVGEPVITLYSGDSILRNAAIRFYNNPQALPGEDVIVDPCQACDEIRIRFLPAFATLTIDGVNKRITIRCLGGDETPGEPFLGANFEWPVLQCIDYVMCTEIDGFYAGTAACVSLDIYPREM